ncbi:hypothetical protein K466DRAFT_579725 [Polyporus arcularius HHB13444]|uniref:DUF6534 domain-containing protein n=1 Tax=Polyporus arcularius HHB13444 TaxID=1314778 RepID=A0A5C3Q884_9APHY|nr:hypothetical protein K466DRAFT_579725 [Polyporus arcularius HHB13444]
MSRELNHVLDLTIGVGLVGFTVAALLYGVTSGQVLLYYHRHGRGISTWRTQCFVAAIWLVDTVHLVLLTCVVYYYDIVIHGNPAGFPHVIWAYGAILITTECNTVLIRLGYAHRIWKYNNRKVLMPLIVIVLAVALLAMGIFYGHAQLIMKSFDDLQELQWSFYLAFALQIVADTCIAISMISVCRRFLTGLRRFDEVIQTIFMFIINTGLLNLALVTLSLIFYYIMPTSFLFLALYWVLAKLHVCSFLAVLNAEKDLIARTSTHTIHHGSTPILTTALRVEDFPTGLPTTQLDSIPLSDLARASFQVNSMHHSPESGPSPVAHAV